MRSAKTPRGSSWGGALTDAVIVLPVLLTMVAGMVMVGTRLSDYMYLNQSARELGLVISRTPGMSWLGFSGGSSSYSFGTPSGGASKDSAERCLTDLRASQGQCVGANTNGCPGCPEIVTQWYAAQFVNLKKLLRSTDVAVNISYGPGTVVDGVADASGLCVITVNLSADTTSLPLMGKGHISVSSTVPYLSTPMNWNGGLCRPVLPG